MQRDMLRIAQRLADAGHYVEIFTLDWQGEKPQGNMVVHVLPSQGLTNIRRYQVFLDKVHNLIEQRANSKTAFDLVLGFNRAQWLDVYFGADPCFKERAFTQRPLLYRLTPRYRWFADCEQAIFAEHSDTDILLLSNQEKPNFQKWYQTPESRFHYIPPYLPAQRFILQDKQKMRAYLREQFQLKPDDFVFLLVGSGFFMKGLDRAIPALASLPVALRQRAKLIAIGQDKPEPMLKLAKQYGVSEQLIISSGRNDIPQLMQGADVYIHPAHRENTGLVILEAMACGLPVLTTATTGYSTYVADAKAGIVVPYPYQQADLDQAMLRMMTSADLAKFSSAGRKLAERVMGDNDGHAEANILIRLAQQRSRRSAPFAGMGFDQIMQLRGTFFRNLPKRKTMQISHQGQSYFVKLHLGVGWAEIIKNLCSLKWPVIGASTEARAIRKLSALGIATTPLVKFDQRGCNPATQQSYLITRDLGEVTSLDEWFAHQQTKAKRQAIIKEMARISATMHQRALYHQDLYLCHFCLAAGSSPSKPKLHLIDLHRCRMLSKPNLRAAVKDLAALYFSAMDLQFTEQDWTMFRQHYAALEAHFGLEDGFWHQVKLRAEKLYQKFHSKKFQQRLAQEKSGLDA
jgi:UDP-glucose:(heptosyl)LPS alpha-1,3-glucosyltransferase